MRYLRAGLVSLVLAWAVLLAGPVAPSSAHAELISTTPADGATLAAVPASVILTFTDEIDPQFVRTALTTPAGVGPVPATTVRHTVTVPITSVGPGSYRLVYRVVSADGHPISGRLTFTVSGTPTATFTGGAAASAADGALSAGADVAKTADPTAGGGGSASAGSAGAPWLIWGAVGLAVVAGAGAVVAASSRGRRS